MSKDIFPEIKLIQQIKLQNNLKKGTEDSKKESRKPTAMRSAETGKFIVNKKTKKETKIPPFIDNGKIDRTLNRALAIAHSKKLNDPEVESVIRRRYKIYDWNCKEICDRTFLGDDCICLSREARVKEQLELLEDDSKAYYIPENSKKFMSFNNIWLTATENEYPIEIGIGLAEPEQIVLNKAVSDELCKGCSAWGCNGCCPPHSKPFWDVVKGNVILIYARLYTKDVNPNILGSFISEPKAFFLTSNKQDVILVAALRLFVKVLLNEGYKLIGDGYCKGCQGWRKKCQVTRGKACVNPTRRLYSPESMGVLLNFTMERVFNIYTYWYYYKERMPPPYLYRTMGVYGDVGIQDIPILKNTLKLALNKKRGGLV